jgi:sulfide:quinone oxidoreductase
MPTHVVILGAGFGGLELSARLSEALADEVRVTLVDRADSFVFGFSKLDVMFGRTVEAAVRHAYADTVKPGVRFMQATVTAIDPHARHVETDTGPLDADILVVALGADLDAAATPGLVEGGHEFYTLAGAFGLRDVLTEFAGGRVVVGVLSAPFKCPPAPSETVLLMHDFLSERGLRDSSEISLVMPFGRPIPPSPDASQALLTAFTERNIAWHPNQQIRALDPSRHVIMCADGGELPYDLFLGVPVHRAPSVVEASSLCVDGWIPVNPLTLETAFDGVYAVGDVTSVGTPKAGVFSEGQAAVVADEIIARHRGLAAPAPYDGNGICYLEFGHDLVGQVNVTFRSGESPVGSFDAPSRANAAVKSEFGSSRIRRWFGRDWSAW